MQSPEYHDLPWVEPAAWLKGRPYGRPLWIVVHTTEGSEGLTSAENGAAYDARREDGTSTHYMHDQDTTIQCVRTTDRANAAKGTGNRFGIHHELCGRAAQDLTQWHDPASTGTLRNFARQAARDAEKWDIPVRHLTVAEIRGKQVRGFCGHNDITAAFGESDHTDPGRAFPWSEVLTMVREEIDMPSAAEIAAAVWAVQVGRDERRRTALDLLLESRSAAQTAAAALPALAARDDVDEEVLGAAVGAALTPALIAYLEQLPEGELTVDDVKAAVRDVLRAGVGG